MHLFPTFRRKARPAAFDPQAEQRSVAEAVLRSATSILRSEDDDASLLLERQCEALTALAPHIVLAWTWFGPQHTTQIRPQVMAGAAADYARRLVIERNLLTQIGPAFRTLAGRRLEPFNVSEQSLYAPWREVAREHGVRSVLGLPLSSPLPGQGGLFVLYSDVEDYFGSVGVPLFEALSHLFSAVLSHTARHAELKRAANCDPLTGLANRSGLLLVDDIVRRLADGDPPCCVALVDIDHFKRINDTHGHAAGDAALCAVAQRLRAAVRRADTVARWGGEEFLVCLPGIDLPAAQRVAEKLRLQLAGEPIVLPAGPHLQLTASLGTASLRTGEPLAGAIARADRALYAAKAAGRNRVMAELDDDLAAQP